MNVRAGTALTAAVILEMNFFIRFELCNWSGVGPAQVPRWRLLNCGCSRDLLVARKDEADGRGARGARAVGNGNACKRVEARRGAGARGGRQR